MRELKMIHKVDQNDDTSSKSRNKNSLRKNRDQSYLKQRIEVFV